MPFIKTSTNISIDSSKKEILKDRLGRAISIMGKPESYLMLEFDDNRELNPNKFVNMISKHIPNHVIVTCDVGQNQMVQQ